LTLFGALSLVACANARTSDAPSATNTMNETRAASVDESAAVEALLEHLHTTASLADGALYFGCFTPDAVFVGTDATERWTLDQFRAYAEPFFARGQGWTYTALERHVAFAAAGDTAWFDERLWNEKYGEARGSGVCVQTAEGWRVAHYVLSFPIPNDLAAEFTSRIRTGS
jgi:hypothetical protein